MQNVADSAETTQRHLAQTGTDRITDNQRSADHGCRNRDRQHHHQMRTSIKQDTAKYELNHSRIVDASHTISHRAYIRSMTRGVGKDVGKRSGSSVQCCDSCGLDPRHRCVVVVKCGRFWHNHNSYLESQSAERLSYVGDVAPRLAFPLLTLARNTTPHNGLLNSDSNSVIHHVRFEL